METQNATQTCISAKTLGQMLALSKRQVFRLRSCQKIPAAVRISGAVRWKLSDIELFLRCDCDMPRFNAEKGGAK